MNIGESHGDEVTYVFGDGTGLSLVCQQAWEAFARDPVNGLLDIGWKKYIADGKWKRGGWPGGR